MSLSSLSSTEAKIEEQVPAEPYYGYPVPTHPYHMYPGATWSPAREFKQATVPKTPSIIISTCLFVVL